MTFASTFATFGAFRFIPMVGLVLLTATAVPALAAADKAAPAADKAAPAKAKTKAAPAADKAAPAAPADKAADKAAADKPASGPPPASSSPMADLKKSNEKLDKVLAKKAPNWSPEAEAQRAEVRKLVGSFLDYGELAKRSLARHWDGLTVKQRDEFVNTLRDLVERSYLKQVHGNPNYQIKYEKETKDGNEATVTGTLHTVARGKKVKVALEYKVIWKDRWVVYDVVTDEQSMLENYRAEFNKIINKEGFDALLKRMKKKLDEKEE
jgi:phospholipid transport system substrate-binding protein